MSLKLLQIEAHNTAIEKGWWEEERSIPEYIALMHSELSEALEAWRKEDSYGVWEEMCDCIIRILDVAEYFDIDIEPILVAKLKYNKTRPYKHGGKRI